ncbi:hypothetical protein Zmor_009029 [Zophobas morio]|uniref:Uncharacterized protein n=1 Tax=Zophobas morio TaxID=2755281 RepID=A0AA38HLM4_9CUCU|nr:hypothetical protein Zmor_009029 [Zophobas morio]
MNYNDVIQPIVIDNGSGVIKAGFAGEDNPKTIFPNLVGRPKHIRVMAGSIERVKDEYLGKAISEHRGLLKLNYPVEHGIVEEWADMELVWAFLYKEELMVKSEEHPVLLTEAPLNPHRNREQTAQLFFETFNVPALYISIQAVLSLYASGHTTGVVLDSGDGVTHSVPVYEGFAMPHSMKRMDLAGREVTCYLQRLLRGQGHFFETSAEFEIVREIKEKMCFLSSESTNGKKDLEKEVYFLPDGRAISIGKARYQAPEILFRPQLIGQEYAGVHRTLVDSVLTTDMDFRQTLFQNIILSGGSTLFGGFGSRLLSEVRALLSPTVKIRILAPQDRQNSTWVGGSILASLSTFKRMWISAAEWREDGMTALLKKTF